MTNLDALINEARERQIQRDQIAAIAEAAETARRRQALIDQLQREVQRALPDGLIAALDLSYETQIVYPQSFASFSYRGATFWLYTDTDRDVRSWHITRLGESERSNTGREVAEIRHGDASLTDRLLLAIAELSPQPSLENR